MEVSMPTGSLCAERNVIGSALADDITLKREDLVAVAVLSATLEKSEPQLTTSISASSLFRGNLLDEEGESKDRYIAFGLLHTLFISAVGSLLGPEYVNFIDHNRIERSSSSRSMSLGEAPRSPGGAANDENQCRPCIPGSPKNRRQISIRQIKTTEKPDGTAASIRNSASEPDASAGVKFTARGRIVQTVAVDSCDMNPLRPCGACSEWIKKIVEHNPRFSIITFTVRASVLASLLLCAKWLIYF